MGSDFLTKLRKEKNLTQKELAHLVGIVPSAICMYENGDRRPSPQVAKRIAEVLGFENEWYKLLEPPESA